MRDKSVRDLKYLQYFEDLLQQANNALVEQAKADGKVCVAYTCENVPEPLLNLDRAVSIRLSAPNTGSIDIATYYMTNLLCEPSRALLERAIEGGFNFADCVITPDGCTMMNRCVENMELLNTMGKENPNFFHQYMEIAFKNTDSDVDLAVLQCTNHVLTPLREKYGIDTSDTAIRKAVEEHNRVCRVIRAISEFRKEEKPRITGYEFHVLCLATYVCPKYLIIDKLEETLEEIRTREPDDKKWRARVLVVGSETDDSGFIKLIEEQGAFVCCDRFCFGLPRPRADRAQRRGGRAAPGLPPLHTQLPLPAHDEHGQGLRPQAVCRRPCEGVRRRRRHLPAGQVLRPLGLREDARLVDAAYRLRLPGPVRRQALQRRLLRRPAAHPRAGLRGEH